ncbi:nitroreductase family protein [Planococcus salinus]|uniref:Putative NAD(P)H nitroreductase n=1 Tax=Planococcus salinus TaxID=1848460 RepID=A0A3M8P6F5_9BACL|nr:nitroreductase [Planococcus salinus]RNF39192.1 nitroreductase [Planococcus salinus]
MDVLSAIKKRRSNGLVSEEPVPRELLEKVLEAGTWAPSHHRTEPWRYFVLTGSGREPLGKVLAKIAAKNMEDPESEKNRKKLQAAADNPFRAPAIITVAAEPSDNPKVDVREEYGAVYASIQNMLLAAEELGLGAYWRTGAPAYDPVMKELFGLSEKGEVLGFLYIGYPKRELPVGKRKPVEEVTVWMTDRSSFENN